MSWFMVSPKEMIWSIFWELLSGFAFTSFGWVQSYGTRCVKPPIIFGDVERPEAMTVKWSEFAQKTQKKL